MTRGAAGCRANQANADARRLKIARLLADAGPLRMRELCRRAGIPPGTFSSRVRQSPWFARTGSGRTVRWGLTAAGRAALATAGGGVVFFRTGERGKPKKPKGWRPGNKTEVHDAGTPGKRGTTPYRRQPGDRAALAKFLAANGPMWGDKIAESLGWTPDRFWTTADSCRWFALERGGWRLTACGREENGL